MKKVLFGLLMVLTFSSCGVNGSKVDGKDFNKKISYLQCQKTGEVFCVIGIRKDFTAAQSGIGLAHIDREDVSDVIKKHIKGFKDFSEFD